MITKKILIVIPVIVVAVIGTAIFGSTIFEGNIISNSTDYEIINVGEKSFYTNTIKFDATIVDIYIADTNVKRNRGLMFEEQLPDNQGMLFIFEESGNYSFWMQNMKFVLDIIWFDNQGNVVHIEQGVPPCNTEPKYCKVYDPGVEAMYVFETTAGFVDRFGITDDSKFFWVVDKII